MTRSHSVALSTLLFAVALIPSITLGQEIPTPGPEHKHLQQLEGTWDAVIKSPDGSPSSKGVSVYKAECGGMWLVSDFNGAFGDLKFQGRGIDGYDTTKKKYVSVWVDSMTTSLMTFEGTHDEKTKTMTMQGEGIGMDGKPAKFKSVTTITDKDNHTFKLFMLSPDGKENLMLTIDYTRRKA